MLWALESGWVGTKKARPRGRAFAGVNAHQPSVMGMMVMSTRRLSLRPDSVSLEAIGWLLP